MIRFAPADAVPAPKALKAEVARPVIKIAAAASPAEAPTVLKEEAAPIVATPTAEPLALSGEEVPKTRKARKTAPAAKRSPTAKNAQADAAAVLLLDLQA